MAPAATSRATSASTAVTTTLPSSTAGGVVTTPVPTAPGAAALPGIVHVYSAGTAAATT